MPEENIVVVVEDEPDILAMVQAVLELEGYTVKGFNHPYHLRTLHTPADLFLVDLMLPEMNGLRVAEMLRDRGYDGTPMIAMSASHQLASQAQHSNLFDAVIRKPFDVDDLLDIISAHAQAG